MEKTKIVIIGGGIAGLSAAQAAREQDAVARIHLICGEDVLPYYRTRIYELLAEVPLSKLFVRNFQWFTDKEIEVVNGRVVAIDDQSKQVKMADGSYLYYDKLVLATGGKGRIPTVEGADFEQVMTFRSVADIERMRRISGPVVVIGGGVLGLEAAWHLSREGRPVVVVERGDWLLMRQLDQEAAAFLLRITENAGVRVALRGDLSYIDENKVALKDGRAFDAVLVIFAAGVEPVYNLGRSMELDCDKAIVVNEGMHTSNPDVFACGDCVEFHGRVDGRWPVSMAEGAVAGRNAAGGDAVYQPQPAPYFMNAMGVSIWSQGNITLTDTHTVKNPAGNSFAKLFFAQNETLAGAVLIGVTDKAMALKKAIDSGMGKAEALSLLNQ
ncbi:MAG: FAD-dependent oxidoreductase [Clostridiales bacterium]